MDDDVFSCLAMPVDPWRKKGVPSLRTRGSQPESERVSYTCLVSNRNTYQRESPEREAVDNACPVLTVLENVKLKFQGC